MYLSCLERHSSRLTQQGFLIPVAAFIVVIMTIFAATLTRTSSTSNAAFVQEAVSLQAFYAAESGAQAGMSRLFYPEPANRLAADSRCASGVANTQTDPAGFQGCNIEVTCSCLYEDGSACNVSTAGNYDGSNGRFYSFYTLRSEAQCGVNPLNAIRTIEVSAYMRDE